MEEKDLITNIEKLRNGEIKNLQVNAGGIDMLLIKHYYLNSNCFIFRIDIDGNMSQIIGEWRLRNVLGIYYDFKDDCCIETATWYDPFLESITNKELIKFSNYVGREFVRYLFVALFDNYMAGGYSEMNKEDELTMIKYFKKWFNFKYYKLYKEMLTTEDKDRENELISILYEKRYDLIKDSPWLSENVYRDEPLTFKYKLQSVEGL